MSGLRWPWITAVNIGIIWLSFLGVGLSPTWVTIQLIMVDVPALLLHFQTRDAKGRPARDPERKAGVVDLGIRLPWSQAGGKFAVFWACIVGTLLELAYIEDWWPRVGVVTRAQVIMINVSLSVAGFFMFSYICRRWPNEPKEEDPPAS